MDHKKTTEKFHALKEHVSTLTNMLAVKPIEAVIKFVGKIWGCDHTEMCKTGLQVLFMTLNDKQNHDVSVIIHKLLSAHPKKVLEAIIDMHKHHHKPLQQPIPDVKSRPKHNVKVPEHLDDLLRIIESAAEHRQKMKAVATNYAEIWVDIGESDGILIDTSSLTSEIKLECLKENVDREIYRHFEAGITVEEIQEHLWPSKYRTTKHPERFRVLEQVTSGPSLSLAGTVSTGAHGNGLNNRIMADAVVSFQIFCVDISWRIKRYQIEPTNGITDPIIFKEKYKDDDHAYQLIQDDDIFNVSLVNIGLLGVVYSYVLHTVPGFCLEEERKIYKWDEAKPIINDLYHGKVHNLYSFQIIASPYAYKLTSKERESHRVLICTLKRAKPPGIGTRSVGFNLVPLADLDTTLVSVGDTTPHLVPLVSHFSLVFLAHGPIVLDAAEALNTLSGIFGDKNTPINVRTSECLMRSEGSETLFQIFEEIYALYDHIRARNQHQLVNVPFAQRIIGKTDKYMAMAYDRKRPTIAIEQSILKGTQGADDTLRRFRKSMMNNFNGRQHWGLLHDMDAEKFAKLYDEHARKTFYAAMNYFDPNYIFENTFAKRVFGEERRRMVREETEIDMSYSISERIQLTTRTEV